MAVSTNSDEEVIVVGAGTTGSSVAYNLATSGKRVIVIDWQGVGAGTTGKSSALVRTHYSNRIIARMALYSRKVLSNFEKIGYSGFKKTGMIFPFANSDAKTARKNVDMLRSEGIREEIMNPTEILRYFPDANLENYDFVTYEPDSGYAEPVATANAFLDKAKELGASVILKKKVISVESNSSGVSAILDDGSTIKGSKMLLATNVWTNDILSNSGVDERSRLPIHASLHGVIYLRRPQKYVGKLPTLWDPPNLAYYKMEGETVTAVGSLDPKLDETHFNIHQNIPETASQEYLEEYLEKIIQRLPSMNSATVTSTIAGLYDMTPDGQAIVDSLEHMGLDSIYVCAGLSGHGFKLSPALGRMVSDMLMEKNPDEVMFDWRPFTAERFGSGKTIGSLYSDIGTIY